MEKIFHVLLSSILWLAVSPSWALPAISCFLTDAGDDSSMQQKEAFSTNSAMIYLLCTSDEVAEGQTVKAVWIAADTQGMAPNHYKIGEKSFEVNKNMDEKKDWTIKYSLSKPYTGWPIGQYHVDLFVDGELANSLKFQVTSK